MKNIIYILIVILFAGCYQFYYEVKPKHHVIQDNYSNSDTTFVLKDYFMCFVNGRYDFIEATDKKFEDSILNIFINSMSEIKVNIYKQEGQNLIDSSLCVLGKMLEPKEALKFTDSLLAFTDTFKKDKLYVLPYFRLVDTAINTSFGTGNVYVNWFSGGIMIIIIKNKKIVYSKFYHGDGVSDNKEKVTDDWPNYPSPPDVLYEQAHWDTLVGLAMEDYMKRLNVEKR